MSRSGKSSSICTQCRASLRRQNQRVIIQRRTLTQQLAASKDHPQQHLEQDSVHSDNAQTEPDDATSFISQMAWKKISGQPLSMTEYTDIITTLWSAKDYDSALNWYKHALETDTPQSALSPELPHHAIAFHWFRQLTIYGAKKKRAILVTVLPSKADPFQAALIDRIRKELIKTLAHEVPTQKPLELLQSFADTVHGLRFHLHGSESFQSYVTFARIANENGLDHFSLGDIDKSFRKATDQKLQIATKSCLDLMDIYAVGRDDSRKSGKYPGRLIWHVAQYLRQGDDLAGAMAHKYILKTVLRADYQNGLHKHRVRKVEACMRNFDVFRTSDTLEVLIRAISHGQSPEAVIRQWEQYAFALPRREPSLYATMLHACASLTAISKQKEQLPRYAITNVLEQMERDLGTKITPSIATGLLRCYMKIEGGLVNVERLLVQADECFQTIEQRSEWINNAIRYLLVKDSQHDYRYQQLACRWVLSMQKKDLNRIDGQYWTRLMEQAQDSAIDLARMYQSYTRAMSIQRVGDQERAKWDSIKLSMLAQALQNEPELLAKHSAKMPFFASNQDAKVITDLPTEELWALLDDIIRSKSPLT